MNFTYKKIEKKDIPYIHELFGTKEYQPIFFEGQTSLQDWENRFDHIRQFEIVNENNHPIGIINITREDPVQILLIALESSKRYQGYGTRIFEDLFQQYPHRVFKVTVKESNTVAFQFYKKIGFMPTDTEIQDLGVHGTHTYINLEKREEER